MLRLLLLTTALFLFHALRSQEFGGNPPSLKWKQVNNDVVRVIFPEGLEQQAVRVADISAYLNRATNATLGNNTRRINIVLQNQTTISNGYVQLAPWRSEFFLTPLQNSLRLGGVNWTDQLAVHEYRHVQQYMNFRKGLSKFAYWLAGEEGQVLANSAAIPDWFFEGDAVFQETLVTGQGRGRLPTFFNEYRAIWESNRHYSYMKLRNGSLKHQVPDHYILGFMLVAYGRNRFGDDVWASVTDKAARFSPLFYPFQGAFKKVTGTSFRRFVDSTFSHHRNYKGYTGSTPATSLTKTTDRYVTSYSFPYRSAGGNLLVQRVTGRHLPGFYHVKDGRDVKIATRDISIDDQYSYRNGKILYARYKPDIRWGWRDFSDLVLLDEQTGQRRKITRGGKYFSPDLSHNGRHIAAVYAPPGGHTAIHILDAGTGQVIHSFTDSTLVYTYPRFMAGDSSILTAVRRGNGEMTLMEIRISTGMAAEILPFTMKAIAFPLVQGDSILFTATHEGQDKLMLWQQKEMKLRELADRYAGVLQGIAVNRDSLVFTATTAWGQSVFTSASKERSVSPEEWEAPPSNLYSLMPSFQKNTPSIYGIPAGAYSPQRYKASTRLFNFHSWRPYYEQPDWTFTLYGQNVLNTFRSSLFYGYNENEGYHQIGYSGAYGAWFPWITGGVNYIAGRQGTVSNRPSEWNELNGNIGLRVPLNFTGGRTYTYLTFSSIFNASRLYFRDRPKEDDLNILYMDNSLQWSIQIQQARQHIYPRFAHTLVVRHRGSVNEREAQQLFINSSLYLPGILRTHNLVINGAYQARDTANLYTFSNNFPLSRGYPAVNAPRMWKYGVNYHFPIVYPDWGFAQFLYFRRIRANMFYDHSYLKSLRTGRVTVLRSAGAEIFFDTKFWNQQDISFGIRYSRLLDADAFARAPNPNQFEFVLPLNLIPR